MILDVAIGKFLDTSLIEADVQPTFVRLLIKGKLMQLTLTEEVSPDKSVAQRNKHTGHLVVTMPKVNQTLRASASLASQMAKTTNTKNTGAASGGGLGKGQDDRGVVSIRDIIKDSNKKQGDTSTSFVLKERSAPESDSSSSDEEVEDDDDEDEIPPLQ